MKNTLYQAVNLMGTHCLHGRGRRSASVGGGVRPWPVDHAGPAGSSTIPGLVTCATVTKGRRLSRRAGPDHTRRGAALFDPSLAAGRCVSGRPAYLRAKKPYAVDAAQSPAGRRSHPPFTFDDSTSMLPACMFQVLRDSQPPVTAFRSQ